MKNFKLVLALLVCTALIALPSYAADPAIRVLSLQNQAVTFDHLLKQTVVKVSNTAAITSYDAVSTNTVDVYMLPDKIEYPIKLRIQNHGAASLTYVPYVTTTTGIILPTATAAHLLTPSGLSVIGGSAYEAVFYQEPNISIGATAQQEVVIEVWGRKNTE